MRDGNQITVHRNNIKVGDIIKIQSGMNIPVDGVCIVGIGVMSDESAMTGESDHCSKESIDTCKKRQAEFEADNKGGKRGPHDVPSPVILSGTQIQTGQGWFVCIVVGDETCEGQILASLSSKDPEQTPLQKKLDEIAMDIGKLGMYTAILVFHCLILRTFIEGMMYRNYNLMGSLYAIDGKPCAEAPDDEECQGRLLYYIKNYLHYLIVGVTIIVVAVPEGLPLAVMISLAYSVKRMLQDKNFVKKLTSCEIMGGANNICSDKTGTLTKNQMTWTNIWAGGDFAIKNPGSEDKLNLKDLIQSEWTRTLIEQGVSCNTIGNLQDAGATELAMLKFISKCSVNFEKMRSEYLPVQMTRFLFDSSRKRMSTVLELKDSDKNENGHPRRLHTKGASEIILDTCSHYLDQQGNKKPLDDQMKQQLEQVIKNYAKNALRTIGFAYKDLKENEGGPDHDAKKKESKIYEIEEGDLTLICIAGIKDIIRDEVPHAVVQCNEAGVRVRMVTGDNKITAIAIAKECGIIKEGEEDEQCVCMEGPEFAEFVGGLVYKDTNEEVMLFGKYPDRERIGDIKNMTLVRNKLKVLARSRPNDKYIMVAGLKELGDIVAVTGDGTNDAPALKRADVGFAMKTGTQVAHNAAAIIIQDDNFASIVKACMWGRNVYDNIRRFLQFQLTVNVVALVTAFIGSVIMWDSPLAAIQLLWVNLIMDSLASLALATELPKDDLLQRPPYRKREYIISKKMMKHILGQAFFQAVVLFVFVFAGPQFVPEGVEGPGNTDVKVGLTEEMVKAHPIEEYAQWTGEYVMSGMLKDFDGNYVYSVYETVTPSRHLSVVFNLFVLFQIFNMLAARKINDELNFFSGIFTNFMFMSVWVIIVIGQVLITQFGSKAMKVHIRGLTLNQWIICLIVSAFSLVWNFILKFVPDGLFPQMGDETEEEVEASKRDYDTLRNIAGSNRQRNA